MPRCRDPALSRSTRVRSRGRTPGSDEGRSQNDGSHVQKADGSGPLMPSLYLTSLSAEDRDKLVRKLHELQNGKCFICDQPIDLAVHADAIDIDHVEPISAGGKDDQSN